MNFINGFLSVYCSYEAGKFFGVLIMFIASLYLSFLAAKHITK